jgi:hypothetical protein
MDEQILDKQILDEQILDKQILDKQIVKNILTPSPPIEVHEIVQLIADFMNYLSVSLYEGQFTKNHEDSYATLNSIYDSVSLTPSTPPLLIDCEQFYQNIVYLANVTYTDDPDYYTYKRILRKYIIDLKI